MRQRDKKRDQQADRKGQTSPSHHTSACRSSVHRDTATKKFKIET